MKQPEKTITPALRFNVLTPIYDVVVRLTTREKHFKRLLLDAADIKPGNRVLDVGCGTGTLLKDIWQREPSAQLTGIDADPKVLSIAQKKLAPLSNSCELVETNSTSLPFNDESFERVVSSLFFHHLKRHAKLATMREIARVLCPGGLLHIADWGLPHNALQRLAFFGVQLLDGFDTTADNVAGHIPALLVESGFETPLETASVQTMFGTMRLLRTRVAAE